MYAVIEHYPEPVGGTWTHYFPDSWTAIQAMTQMAEAHPHRMYEINPE